ncbi:uncharacterized protein DEA37_0006437 [Paragonimus westermani]|uniref:Uncharacterized protein n=1 Tax=Paragonimus westermani TaxID=34504 RepID=A0A5J4NIL2_9TREM|nr:uncharacterized protein DEA37_0006437 [Paragonimus westermani]
MSTVKLALSALCIMLHLTVSKALSEPHYVTQYTTEQEGLHPWLTEDEVAQNIRPVESWRAKKDFVRLGKRSRREFMERYWMPLNKREFVRLGR